MDFQTDTFKTKEGKEVAMSTCRKSTATDR